MDKSIVFRSVLIFLLLCYGKKFVDANERNQTGSVSQQNSSLNQQQFARTQESFPINQNPGFHQPSAQNPNVQQGSQNYTEIKINRQSHKKSVQLITLDVGNKRSTNEVKYSLGQDGTHSFICNDGFLIKEVIKDGKIGWRPTNDAYAYGMVFIENYQGRPKLTALIDDEDDFDQPSQPMPRHHPQPQPQQHVQHPMPHQQPQQPMAQPQQHQHRVQQVFHGPQQAQESPVASSDLSLNDIFVVDRNSSPGSSDSDDVQVRRGTSDTSYVSENFGIDETSDFEYGNHSPKRRPASSDSSYNGSINGRGYEELTIGGSQHSGTEHSHGYDSGYDQSRRRTRIPRSSKHGKIASEVKNIMVLDVSIENNEGYDVIENLNDVVFKARPTFLFSKIKNGNQVVWEPRKQGDYADGVLVKIGKNDKLSYEVFIHEEPALDEEEEEEIPVQVQRRQNHPPVQPQQAQNVYAPEVNILTLDSAGALKVNDGTQYDLKRHNNILKYQFHPGAMCVEVKYLRETVWRAEEYYPHSVAFNRTDNTFVIDFGTAYVHCQKRGNTWANALHKYNAHNDQMGVKYNQSYPREVSNQVEPKKDLTPMAHKATAVVDIDTRNSANEFEFSKKSDDCGTYTPKHNFIFKVVKGSVSRIGRTVDIWHPDSEEEYVTKVVIDGVSLGAKVNNATLFLANGNIKHFTILKKAWVEVDPSVILNIQNKKVTCEYNYYIEGKIETFTPKGHFLFQGIKQTVKNVCGKTDVDIWETNDPLEYGTKVMVVSTKQSEKYVVMFLLNHHYKLFYKSGKNSMWKDESDNASTISNLKLQGVDIADDKHYGIKNGQKKGTHVSELAGMTGGAEMNQGGDRLQVVHGSLDAQMPGDPMSNYTASNLKNMRQASEPVEYSRRTSGPSGAVTTPQTVRKVVVEHVACQPGQIEESEESEVTYRDSATSTSEDSDQENHSGHSQWINLRH